MAEVLGAVASGIAIGQLAGHVAGSIIKLKHYWDQVKDAPDEIRHVLLEIDSLNLIMGHIGDDVSVPNPHFDKLYVEQSLRLCREGAAELSTLVAELAEKVEGTRGLKKKLGGVKVVLRKEDFKKLKKRMKTAISLLSLAYQCHTNAMIRLQPDIIVARITNAIDSMTSASSISEVVMSSSSDLSPQRQSMDMLTNEQTAAGQNHDLVRSQYRAWMSSPSWVHYLTGSLKYWHRYEIQKGRQRRILDAKYQCPAWISDTTWYARCFKESYSGWKFYFQPHRVLPWNHDIFTFAETGNLTGLQELLSNGEGCVTDRPNTSGWPLLHVAVKGRQVKICEFLLDTGADPLAEDDGGLTAIQCLCHYKPRENEDVSKALDICRLLRTKGAVDSDPLVEDHGSQGYGPWMEWFRGSPSLFQLLQQQMYPPYMELRVEGRLEILSTIDYLWNETSNELFTLALGKSTFTRDMVTCHDSRGRTVLHWIARAWSNLCWFDECQSASHRNKLPLNSSPGLGNIKCWRMLLQNAILTGALLHPINTAGSTPLCTLMLECPSPFYFLPDGKHFEKDRAIIRLINTALWHWLKDLQESGVDLEQYGKKEAALGLKHRVNSGRSWRRNHLGERFHLNGFSYGSQLRDWKFWFSEPTDYFAGRFWAMIEKSDDHQGQPFQGSSLGQNWEFNVPGAWKEYDERSDSASETDWTDWDTSSESDGEE